MSEDERRLVALFQEAVPQAQVSVTFESLEQARRRQRRTSLVVAAAAAVAIAVPAVWWATSPDGSGAGAVANSPKPTPTTEPTGPASGCPETEPVPPGQGADIDYVDFLRFGGREYFAGMDGDVNVTQEELGPVVGEVTCSISELTESGDWRIAGPFLDGNAAFLPIGTELHAVNGYDQSCRIAARVDGELVVYLAQRDVDGVSKARRCAFDRGTAATTVTPCDQLPPVPQGTEVNTVLDEENGWFEYDYGPDGTSFRIAYRDDPTCAARPDVQRLLRHAIDTAASNR